MAASTTCLHLLLPPLHLRGLSCSVTTVGMSTLSKSSLPPPDLSWEKLYIRKFDWEYKAMKLLLYPGIEKLNKLAVYRSNDAAIGKYILKDIHFVT